MTLAKSSRQASFVVLVLALAVAFGLMGNQRHAQAQVPVVDPVSPIAPPASPTGPAADGEEINCDIYKEFGEPIPPFCKSDGAPPPPPPGDEPGDGEGDDNGGDGSGDTPPPGGGSGSGSSGGGGGGGFGGQVLGAATDPSIACDLFLTGFIRPGGVNNPEQVKRLQSFLNTYEGAVLVESGVYDAASIAAVHAFQRKYAAEILAPWGISQSTGYMYLTTRKKVNELRCNQLFTLSAAEWGIIQKARAARGAPQTAAPVPQTTTPAPVPSFVPAVTLPVSEPQPAAVAETALPAPEATAPRGGVWSTLRGLFGRLFGR